MRREMSLVLVLGLVGCAAPGGSRQKSDNCRYGINGQNCPKSNNGVYYDKNPTGKPLMPRNYDPTSTTP